MVPEPQPSEEFMDERVVIIYCPCDDFLRARHHYEDPPHNERSQRDDDGFTHRVEKISRVQKSIDMRARLGIMER